MCGGKATRMQAETEKSLLKVGNVKMIERVVSALANSGGFDKIVAVVSPNTPKTKEFLGVLSALRLDGTTLFVGPATDKNLSLATRNIARVSVTTSESLNTYDVLKPNKLVFTRDAFEQIEARLGKADQAPEPNAKL